MCILTTGFELRDRKDLNEDWLDIDPSQKF